jgi:hypothetical protein
MRLSRGIGALGLLLAAGTAGGCSNDPAGTPVDASVRFVNASPDSPPLDVLFDGGTVVQALGSGQPTVYLTVNAGSPTITIRQTGTQDALVQATPTLSIGGAYTLVAMGPFASLEAAVLTDDNTIPGTGNTRLRGVHAAASAAALDVYITAPGADLAVTQPAFSALAFRGVSPYISLAAGQYQIRLTLAGTKTVEHDAGSDFTFGSREVHSVYILETGPTPLSIAAVLDAASP